MKKVPALGYPRTITFRGPKSAPKKSKPPKLAQAKIGLKKAAG